MPIRKIHVAGYRSVRDLTLRLHQINLLVGPNGSGKSNLYNSVFLLAKAASGGLAQVIAKEGGMPSVLWAGEHRTRSANPSNRDPVRMSLAVSTNTFSYELQCGLPKPYKSAFDLDPEVKEERVWMDADGREVNFFQRNGSAVWIRDREGRRASYAGELLKQSPCFRSSASRIFTPNYQLCARR